MAYYGSYGGYEHIAGSYGGWPLPSLDAILYPCSSFDPNSPSQEEYCYGSISSTEEGYEGEQLPYSGYGNWPSEYNFFSHGDHGSGLMEKTEECIYQIEEQCDSYYSYYQDSDEQPACDYINPWYGREEEDWWDEDCGGRQEPKCTYSYSQDEMGFCEVIFGYWPCLFRIKDQKSYGEEGANEQSYGYTSNWTVDSIFGSSSFEQ